MTENAGNPAENPAADTDQATDRATDSATDQAAVEAAQRVVEEVSSWEYSAERDTIGDRLDEGLRAAGVALDDDERTRILAEIDEMKDEHSEAPRVRSARPAS